MWPVSLFFLKNLLLCIIAYQENLNIHSWIISCPDGITPNSGLTGPKNTTYIYIYIYNLNRELEIY